MYKPKHKQSQTVTKPYGIATALAVLCLLLALMLNPTSAHAADGVNNRKDAISQALSRSDSDAKVLGVKQIKQNNGSIVFAVKIISNGRVKVIQIPKTRSE